MKAINITRKWIKNFIKLIRFFTRLIDKMKWKWHNFKQLFYDIFKIKCTIKIFKHDINFNLIIHFYTDVSEYETDLIITQYQRFVNMKTTNNKNVKIFIFYDNFSVFITKRQYFIYKRKLYAIIIFIIKYNYLCKHFYCSVIVHTNYQFLIYFFNSNVYENLYEHWTDQMRRFNISIQYVSKYKNKIIDALSRILFDDEKCHEINKINKVSKKLKKRFSKWM